MKFKLLINIVIVKIKTCLGVNHQSQSFILIINVKMPTVVGIVGILTFMSKINIVGILTFMSRINFKLSRVEHEKVL